MVFHWSQSDCKFPQSLELSLLSSLAAVWMVTTHPLISKSSSPYTNPLVTVPNTPVTIGITITFMFHSFFRSRNLSLFSPSFSSTLSSAETAKSSIWLVLFFFLTITRTGHLAEIRWSISISKFKRILCILFSKMESGLCIYHLFVWLDLNFLLTQLCLLLYSLCTNLLHLLLCDWSFHLYHYIVYICYFVAFCLFLLWHS